jgi:hypothetical protein
MAQASQSSLPLRLDFGTLTGTRVRTSEVGIRADRGAAGVALADAAHRAEPEERRDDECARAASPTGVDRRTLTGSRAPADVLARLRVRPRAAELLAAEDCRAGGDSSWVLITPPGNNSVSCVSKRVSMTLECFSRNSLGSPGLLTRAHPERAGVQNCRTRVQNCLECDVNLARSSDFHPHRETS